MTGLTISATFDQNLNSSLLNVLADGLTKGLQTYQGFKPIYTLDPNKNKLQITI
jgi:hypothetical protein